MAEIFTVRWAGPGQSRREGSESAALALRRPDGSEIGHEALLVMMAAD